MAGCRGTLASRASLRGRERRVARAVGGHHGGACGGKAVLGTASPTPGCRRARPGLAPMRVGAGSLRSQAPGKSRPAGGAGGREGFLCPRRRISVLRPPDLDDKGDANSGKTFDGAQYGRPADALDSGSDQRSALTYVS